MKKYHNDKWLERYFNYKNNVAFKLYGGRITSGGKGGLDLKMRDYFDRKISFKVYSIQLYMVLVT